MVNGRTLEAELLRIEKIFYEMKNDEFESMLIECGIKEIEESNQSNYVIACEPLIITSGRYVNNLPYQKNNKIEQCFDNKDMEQELGAA